MKSYMSCKAFILAAIIGVLMMPASGQAQAGHARATFAGGCFWCMEPPFDDLEGVVSTVSGYTGGDAANPTYEQVSSGETGHAEAVQVTYDPDQVDYSRLLAVFWHNIDPVDDGGQFCDRGSQYRSAVFYHNADQKTLAEKSRKKIASRFSAPIATEIEPLEKFYPAEDYHQNYYREHAIRYKFYRTACGRDGRLEELWGDAAGGHSAVDAAPPQMVRAGFFAFAGDKNPDLSEVRVTDWQAAQKRVSELVSGITVNQKPLTAAVKTYDPARRIVHEEDAAIAYPVRMSEEQWQKRLTETQFRILRQSGTEPAFDNPLYDNQKAGIYYSAATGQPLFDAADKFESGTGWPSFTRPIAPDAVVYVYEESFFSKRIEVVDSLSGSHLGHVFADGPAPTGQRYCMNSAALIFVPAGEPPPPLLVPKK